MPGTRTAKRPRAKSETVALSVRLDDKSQAIVARAAELRRVSVSDYVGAIAVAHARQEVEASRRQVISLSPTEQLAFWNALNAPIRITPNQKRLAAVMRGEK